MSTTDAFNGAKSRSQVGHRRIFLEEDRKDLIRYQSFPLRVVLDIVVAEAAGPYSGLSYAPEPLRLVRVQS